LKIGVFQSRQYSMKLLDLVRAVAGGAMIGAAATIYWRANGRVAGISGILRGALVAKGDRGVQILFLVGLVAAGLVGALAGVARSGGAGVALPVVAVAGLLVGVGTRLGGGCTSGHGVCGISRLSHRAIAATVTFMATGAVTVFVVAHVLPSVGLSLGAAP
jgi:uncharacterized membrane protein YedE/YeeE